MTWFPPTLYVKFEATKLRTTNEININSHSADSRDRNQSMRNLTHGTIVHVYCIATVAIILNAAWFWHAVVDLCIIAEVDLITPQSRLTRNSLPNSGGWSHCFWRGF